MKSKFGFIPIVLPVLVMVLIIGAINLVNMDGVRAQEATDNIRVNVSFTALDDMDAALDADEGGISNPAPTEDGGGENTSDRERLVLSFGIASSTEVGEPERYDVKVGSAAKHARIIVDDDITGTRPVRESFVLSYIVYRGDNGVLPKGTTDGELESEGEIIRLVPGQNIISFKLQYDYRAAATDATSTVTSYHQVNMDVDPGVDPADRTPLQWADQDAAAAIAGNTFQYEEGVQIYRRGLEYPLIKLPQAEGGNGGGLTYTLKEVNQGLPDGMEIYASSSLQIRRGDLVVDSTTITTDDVDSFRGKDGTLKTTYDTDQNFGDCDVPGHSVGDPPGECDNAGGSGDVEIDFYNTTTGAIFDNPLTADTVETEPSAGDGAPFPLALGGRPNMISSNQIDDYPEMVYSVTDGAQTLELRFSIRIHRDPLPKSVRDQRPEDAPLAMHASYAPLDNECNALGSEVDFTVDNLAEQYRTGTHSYTVVVPTAIDKLDFWVVASSTDKVYRDRSRARSTSTLANLALATDAAGLGAHVDVQEDLEDSYSYTSIDTEGYMDVVHKWQVDLNDPSDIRDVSSTYNFQVNDGNTYRVTVVRKIDASAGFSDDSPLVLRFFQGTDVEYDLPEADLGNGTSSRFTYEIEQRRKDGGTLDSAVQKHIFSGLRLETDEMPMPTTSRTLMGMANVGATRDGTTPSKSQAFGAYIAHDDDCNREDPNTGERRDHGERDLEVHVYLDVSLHSIDGGDSSVEADIDDLNDNDLVYRASSDNEYVTQVYSYDGADAVKGYAYKVRAIPGATSTDITLTLAVATGTDAVYVDREMATTSGAVSPDATGTWEKELTLTIGDNEVPVKVESGSVVGHHMLNLMLSGPAFSALEVTPYNPDTGKTAGGNLLSGDNAYDEFTHSYTVDTFHSAVKVAATGLGYMPGVTATVNGDPQGQVEMISLDEGANDIVIVAMLDGVPSQTYTVTVNREMDSAPTFEMDPSDLILEVGKDVPASKQGLPKAMGGNGDGYTYDVVGLPMGLTWGTSTDADGDDVVKITGKPADPGITTKAYTVTYKAHDEDLMLMDSDAAIETFVIAVTNNPVADDGDGTGGPTDPAPAQPDDNDLERMSVTYTVSGNTDAMDGMLEPAFSFDRTSYDLQVPDEYDAVYVTATRASPISASIKIGDNTLAGDLRTPGRKFTKSDIMAANNMIVITVVPDEGDSNDYSITVRTESDTETRLRSQIEDTVYAVGTEVMVTLPEAVGGNVPYTYMLKDSRGNDVGGGLNFDADPDTRSLSGTATLAAGTPYEVRMMTYTATDKDGDIATSMYMLRICDPDAVSDCVGGGGPVDMENPGSKPMDLVVSRDGTSADMTWTPGDDASKQEVAAIDPADPQGSIIATAAELGGDAETHTFSGLTAGVMYIYVVVGYDADGNYKDADGNGYWAVYAEMSGN